MKQINVEKLDSNIQLILEKVTGGTLYSLDSLKEIIEVSQLFEFDQKRCHSIESLQAFKLWQEFLKQIMVVTSPQGENICHQLIKENKIEVLQDFLGSLNAYQSVQEQLLLSVNEAGYSAYAYVFATEDPELIQQALRILSSDNPESLITRDGNWKDAVWWSIIRGNIGLTKKLSTGSDRGSLTLSEQLEDYSALGLTIFCKAARQIGTRAVNMHTQLDNLTTQMAIATVNGVNYIAQQFPVNTISLMSKVAIVQPA